MTTKMRKVLNTVLAGFVLTTMFILLPGLIDTYEADGITTAQLIWKSIVLLSLSALCVGGMRNE